MRNVLTFGSILLGASSSRSFTPLSSFRWVNSRVLSGVNCEADVVSAKTELSEVSIAAKPVAKLTFLLPNDSLTKKSKFGWSSPAEVPSLYEAAVHIAKKANWYADEQLEWETVLIENGETKFSELCSSDILIAFGLDLPDDLAYVHRVFEARRMMKPSKFRNRLCHFALDCAESIPALVGPYDPTKPSLPARFLPWSLDATGRRMHAQMLDLFSRWTSDDFCYGLVVFLNQFSGSEIDWVKHQTDASWEKGPIKNAQELYRMLAQCQDCIVPCMKDDQCRECLGKMSRLDPRDQVTSYRTIVSYESDLLTNLSRCIFTKKNIFQCNAKIPTCPKVPPMASWRGQVVTEEIGRSILVGHLDDDSAPDGSSRTNVSWMVACGANVAYDQFPSQHQLFYPTSRGRDMWYDPYFRVTTLDGRNIWCKRHYKVRPGPSPGTFRLSTSDNGVTSDEMWTIVGVADDLSWLVVHYAGAAKAVGLQYIGGLLCTPDGSLPNPAQLPTIWKCLQTAGIQPWELTVVDNRYDTPSAINAGPPPLDYYRTKIIKSRVANNVM
jgi:hypothetical protein